MDIQVDHSAYSDAVKVYLSDKYHENFTVEAVYREFSGDTGNLIRLQCRGTSADGIFTVRCYLDPEITSQILKIDGKDHSVEDNYAEILCQKQLTKLLLASDGENCAVKCRVDFYGRQPTVAEYALGWQDCLKNEALRTYIKIYILSDGNEKARTLYKNAECLVEQCDPNTGYLYFAVTDHFEEAQAEAVYAEKQNDFGNFLVHEDYARQVWFTLYETASGLQDSRLVKG